MRRLLAAMRGSPHSVLAHGLIRKPATAFRNHVREAQCPRIRLLNQVYSGAAAIDFGHGLGVPKRRSFDHVHR
jgi:hypothetical protein